MKLSIIFLIIISIYTPIVQSNTDNFIAISESDYAIPTLSAQSIANYPTATLASSIDTNSATIDLMLFWDLPFQEVYGGVTETLVQIQKIITTANNIFKDSGIYIKLNLVHSGLKAFPVDVATNGRAISYFKDNNSNYGFADIDTLKQTHKPDLVGLIRKTTIATNYDGICGIAYVLGRNGIMSIADSQNAFFIVNYGTTSTTSCSEITFAHEIGHNLGSAHDLANSSFMPIFDNSYAYGEAETAASQYGTVMAYARKRLFLFSNPDVSCNVNNADAPNIACGNETFNDNAKGFNAVRHTVALFNGNSAGSILTAKIAANQATSGCSMLNTQSDKIDLTLLLMILLCLLYLRPLHKYK